MAVCRSLGAEDQGLLEQKDTYFRAARGRLKLREENGATAHLISYERPDRTDRRESRYRIVPTERADELKAALGDALGVEVVVAKARRLFLWRGVRIHLDRVEGLGDFIEFEAVIGEGLDPGSAARRVEELRRAFAIGDDRLVGAGYSDLAMAASAAQPS